MKGDLPVIVGLHDSHDASACIFVGSELVCAVSEERFQRVKSMSGFPDNALHACLRQAHVTPRQVDLVVFGSRDVSCENLNNFNTSVSVEMMYRVQEEYWDPVLLRGEQRALRNVIPDYRPKGNFFYDMTEIPLASNREVSAEAKERVKQIRHRHAQKFFAIPAERVVFCDHHDCHAYYAYYAHPRRPSSDLLVLTADAGGDQAYESVQVFNARGERRVLHKGRTNLLGSIYSQITLLLGMKPNEHEFKVMGLAPYAKEYDKRAAREVFLRSLTVDGLGFNRNPEMTDLFRYFERKLRHIRFDAIAGGLQDFLEVRMREWVRNAIDQTGVRDVAISGGVALNIKCNKRLIDDLPVRSLFAPAGAGDESLPIGACCMALTQQFPALLAGKSLGSSAYWGPSAGADEVEQLAQHPFVREHFTVTREAKVDQLAELLAQGAICGVFMGRMEFGPRALGHRSIIADPSKPDVVKRINEAIKMRDFWMPFTFSVLDERFNDYIVSPAADVVSNFMTVSFDTTPLGRAHLAGAIHPYDLTARPQRVDQQNSLEYYQIIKAFERRTGIGAVLNTSLNIHGKPIVNRPREIATELLVEEGVHLDCLFVEGTLFVARDLKLP